MKDKKEFSMYLDSSVVAKYGENASTMARFNIQTIGGQLASILRGETKVKNFNINKTTAGVTVTFLDGMVTGFKFEDQIAVGKRLVLVGSTRGVRYQDETNNIRSKLGSTPRVGGFPFRAGPVHVWSFSG